ncbi:AraC family transcriptional regulator [Cupriavidus numazuensis]|uniref:HTH-type transcriptional regulator n=1 Tax=Cupriavidus numazuensis TaxID=221992 RepID=A0ABM8TTQ1_9BURK|nr:AraC family transcriptional regulator [Cupriavidus numazuensis]CAG2159851.1 putative HTH-type transcriptional regulator [Cupriavidus numazuensis]
METSQTITASATDLWTRGREGGYLAHAVAVLVRFMEARGVAPELTLRDTGLEMPGLLAPAKRLSKHQILKAFGNALERFGEPGLGLQLGARMHIAACGIYGYALLSSRTHAEAIEFASKYHDILSPFTPIQFVRHGGNVGWRIDPAIDAAQTDPLYRFVVELTAAGMLTLLRELYGSRFQLSLVEMAGRREASDSMVEAQMGCPVSFNAPFNAIWFDEAWTTQPMTHSDPITHETMRELCEIVLLKLPRDGQLAGRVRRLMLETPGQFPDMDRVAGALALNPRTLQRMLDEEGTSFRQILAEVRMNLADVYLRVSDLTVEEIANRLGYSDPPNFRRAFIRWKGLSPSEYRKQLAGSPRN